MNIRWFMLLFFVFLFLANPKLSFASSCQHFEEGQQITVRGKVKHVKNEIDKGVYEEYFELVPVPNICVGSGGRIKMLHLGGRDAPIKNYAGKNIVVHGNINCKDYPCYLENLGVR